MKTSQDPIDSHIGKRLRLLRTSRHLSLEELGRRVGVTYQQIQKYETGANRIAAATLYRLALALDVAPTFFFQELEGQSAPDAHPGELDAFSALRRIDDPQIRQSLLDLVEALGQRR